MSEKISLDSSVIIYICTRIRRVDIIINVNLFLCYDEQTVGFC